MATRSCLRCCKSVPETASFCRRCGLSLHEHHAVGGFGPPVDLDPLPSLAAPAPPRGNWPGVIVVTAVIAVWAVLVLFTASIPRVTSNPWKCPASAAREDAADHEARLARVREHLTSTRERVEAAREQLAAARRRFDWKTLPELPQLAAAAAPAAAPTSAPDPPSATPPSLPLPRQVAPTLGGLRLQDLARPDAPRITGFSAWRGPAGKRLAVDGAGFTGTSRVLFASPGIANGARGSVKGWREAGFRVRDDGRLMVTVPDLGPDEQEPTIVVITPRGAAVTVSPGTTLVSSTDEAPEQDGRAYYVTADAALAPPRGAPVVVDRGGSLHAAAGSLVVVRSGGGVERARTDCLIIRETRRPQPRDLLVTPVLDVPAVNACFLDSPFQYSGR